MRTLLAVVAMLIVAVQFASAQDDTTQLAEPYRAVYTGGDATGDHVIALWQFDGDEPGKDVSGNGHDLELVGANIAEGGRFGGALECFPGWPVEDVAHRAVAKRAPALTPTGPFTVEMWINPKPEIEGYPESFLLDNRYVDMTGMQLILNTADGTGARRLRMVLGFGTDTETYTSKPFVYETGAWHHVAFTYDKAGTGRFFVDGAAMGTATVTGRGAVAPGEKDLMIGDRVGSYYHGFPGLIDQVRICDGALEFQPAGFEFPAQRKVFVRMEANARLKFVLTNKLRTPVQGARAYFMLEGMPATRVDLPDLAPGALHELAYDLNTALRPGEYELQATIEIPGDTPYRSTEEFKVTLVPRPLPHLMPVVMWGANMTEVDRLKDLGFTHAIDLWADLNSIWNAGKPIAAASDDYVAGRMEAMDYALANGISAVSSLSPGSWARSKEEVQRLDRDGKPYAESDVNGLYPQVQEFCYNVGASVAQSYGSHPALKASLIQSEVRGGTRLSFSDIDREAFRKFSGAGIPEGLADHRGTVYQSIDGFPEDRVIPDDFPMYVFYKWFWKEGDGWNGLHTALHRGLKSTGRDDLWTFYDPAVRCPSIYGSGGDVDYLSHWTYSYPDPIRIGLCTDELLCMAAGAQRGDQQVMKMTQIIWYRSQTAPEPGEEAATQTADFVDHDTRPQGTGTVDGTGRYQAAWERKIPDARFITIAPMHLREAFWSKVSRPIKGIMYHGWQSLVAVEDQSGAYKYTHPETRHELRRLAKTVVEPLGPTLVQVPDRKSDVAFLESFASQMFARRGTWGWNGSWAGDVYLALLYAHLQPQVIYDETVQQEGLDQFKVLVLADCDVLPFSVVRKIQAFQDGGGIIVGDERLCPAIQPDILIQSHARPKEADKARALLMEDADRLCAELDPHYQRYYTASNRDIVTRARQYGTTDYLFAVNDLREFGDYVGHHGLVMENGLPASGNLQLRRGGYVYDLLARRQVLSTEADTISLDADFGPCEGRLYMVTERPIASVIATVPDDATTGQTIPLDVQIVDEDRAPLDAVVPVRVDILDPDGKLAEFSGYYGAKDGRLTIDMQIAPNDVFGLWRAHVEELASGTTADAYFRVKGAE